MVTHHNDYDVVRDFRTLRGRAYRPLRWSSQARPAAKRRELLALIPGFQFEPLRRILEILGQQWGTLTELDEDLGSSLDARELAQSLLKELSQSTNARCQEIVTALSNLHRGLVRKTTSQHAPDLISCPGSRTLSRIVAAFEAWQENAGQAVLAVSGAYASYDQDSKAAKKVREADAYAACLRLWGVPEEKIARDLEATTTRENATFLERSLEARSAELGRKIHLLLVTTGFHTTRYLLSVRRLYTHHPAVASINIRPGPSFLEQTLIFDEGGQQAVEKIAILLNEYLKIHFDVTRVVSSS